MNRALAIVWLISIVGIDAGTVVLLVRGGMGPVLPGIIGGALLLVGFYQYVAFLRGIRWLEAALSFLTGVVATVLLYQAGLGGLAVGCMLISSVISASTAISEWRISRASVPPNDELR